VTEYTLLSGGKVWELCATELVDNSVFIDGAFFFGVDLTC